ncbi:hypothetical protein BST81_07065 [Leptolyngbya sp. 'hensonii']|uniref:hypothetical protein n=1 Tax=Leptolyngbya sp. 'hensonii' TaxID=1922337 RepID=UPI0009500303|nr:hypothetical protein [Leptolyngbya sp. 'hensonii']OLP18984.1 hypothetical protein BST81_07065 [Leptolyngbya sp. 'hensonii']
MKKNSVLTSVLLAASVLMATSLLTACGGGNETSSSPSPTTAASSPASPSSSPSSSPASPEAAGLDVEDAVLAKKTGENNGQPQLSPVESNVFKPGETVYLVLKNTGKFKKGTDGKHKIEMDVQVTDSSGKVLLSKENLLGDKGVVELANDIAPAPYGNVDTTPQTPPGTYTISVTIYDKNSDAKATKSAEFKIQ